MIKVNRPGLLLKALALLICGVFLMSGCIQMPQQGTQGGAQPNPSTSGKSCVPGTVTEAGGIQMKVIGLETHTIEGKTMEFCCVEKTAKDQKSKSCMDTASAGYTIVWLTDGKTGQLYKSGEIYPQNGKTCVRTFNPNGEVLGTMCN